MMRECTLACNLNTPGFPSLLAAMSQNVVDIGVVTKIFYQPYNYSNCIQYSYIQDLCSHLEINFITFGKHGYYYSLYSMEEVHLKFRLEKAVS